MLQDKKTSIKKTGLLVACFWSLVLFLSLYANILQEYKGAEKQATLVARANLDRDKAVRQWVSDRGGVYAKISELTQPSPYLAHIPTRDIQTLVGDMTLLNPAYMLRLMMDEHELLYGIKGRIVGLKALRPENIADDWERNAISQFEADRELKDYTEFDVINGESYMRMMIPLYMTPDCMKCHSILGYQVGDLRGGVNVSVPLSDYYALARLDSIRLGYAHGGIWLLGLFGIGFVTKRSVKAEKLRNRDIQELKETEKALREGDKHFRALFDQSSFGVAKIDSVTRKFIKVNKRYCDLVGYSMNEMLEINFQEITVAEDLQSDLKNMDRLRAREISTFQMEKRYRCRDGSIIWVKLTVLPLWSKDKEPDFHLAIVEDITAHKKIGAALQESEALLEKAQTISQIGHWKLNPATGEISGSEELFRIFGLNKSEATLDAFVGVVHPDDREMDIAAIQRGAEYGESWDIEHRIITPDGTEKWAHAIGEVSTDEEGNVVELLGTVQDITERRLTEQSLLQSEARLNEAQRLARVGVWELNLLTGELVWSDEIFRIFEIDKNKFQASYKGFLSTVHSEDRDMVDKAYSDSLIDKQPYEIIHRLQMSSGEIKYVHEKCKSYFDRDGKAVRSVGTVHEITERKKTEDELARVQEMLEQANKVAKMGAWSFDLISNELVWSDITKEIHEVEADYKPVIEEGINFYKEGIHRDTINRIVMEAMQNGGSWDEELLIVTAKGNEKWVRAMGQPEFKDGTCIGLFGSFQDITERKQAEVALVISEARYRRAEEGTNDGLWEWNIVTGEDYFSPRWLAMLGYNPNELPYHVDTFIDLIHPDDLPAVKAAMENHLQNDESYDIEMRMRHKNDNYIWVNSRGQAERNTQGDPIVMSGFITNITERKQNEVELQKYRHQLEGLVEDRTAELQQSLMEKEVLLKEVHHRVKNNMAMVSAFIQLQMNGADDVYSLGALGACESRIQAMSMVHKRLYQSSDFTNIEMKILFDEISSALFKESDFDNIELDIQAKEIYLEMDEAIPCAMIVNELLSNSLKYAFKDGQSGKINIHMGLVESGLYRIRVSDSGVGFPEDMNIENAETLGLQLVNVFVGQLNGEIKISRGHGVTFEIIFRAGKTTNA